MYRCSSTIGHKCYTTSWKLQIQQWVVWKEWVTMANVNCKHYKARKKEGKNTVESWRQWSSGWSSRKRPEFPTWNSQLDDRSKRIFPVLKAAEVMLDWQHGQCWMFIPLSLEKRALNPDLDHTRRLVIALQCLQLATDSFQNTHCWICNFQLVV